MSDSLEILSLGNEGFRLAAGGAIVYIDALFRGIPLRAAGPMVRASDMAEADAILVTHAHWDHFHPAAVAEGARRTGAAVIGPKDVAEALRPHLPAEQVICLSPPLGRPRTAEVRGTRITAFHTFHDGAHNSYLIELGGYRVFHDGDNENTRPLDPAALRRLDALLIGPWQGSGWVEFIADVSPRYCLLMHLTDRELDDHEAGTFLPSIHDRPPTGLIALRPGQSLVIEPPPHARRDGGADPGQENVRA